MIDEKKLIDGSTWHPQLLTNTKPTYHDGWNACNRDWIKRIEEMLRADGPDTNVGTWIPCSERLPKRNTEVLVYRPKMAMPILVDRYECYYGEDDNDWHEGWAYSSNCTVTAWMPLPEPYKESED